MSLTVSAEPLLTYNFLDSLYTCLIVISHMIHTKQHVPKEICFRQEQGDESGKEVEKRDEAESLQQVERSKLVTFVYSLLLIVYMLKVASPAHYL